MANNNAPFGLKPQNLNGTTWSGQMKMIYIPSSQGAIYIGDPLIPLGTTDAFGVPGWGIATAGATNIIGGCYMGRCNGPAGSGVTLTQGSTIYHPTTLADYGYVCDDPDVLYTIQDDGGTIATTAAGYSNGNLVAGGGGSTSTGLSSWALQGTSVASGNPTYQVRVLGLTRGPDNVYGIYARWNIIINLPALQPNASGL